jgi:hypothetical protein
VPQQQHQYLRQAPNLKIHPVPNGYVVRQPEGGGVHHLNPTAALLFELSNGQVTAEDVAGQVKKTFGLRDAEMRAVRESLAALIRAGLIVSEQAKPRTLKTKRAT